MSENSYGVTLHDADDVLPLGLVGTPWEIIFKALRDVLKSGVGASDSDFMRKACALYFLARGDLDAVTDRGVLNGIAAVLALPYWLENFDDPKRASAIIYHWIKYKPTRANLTVLALASGMRAFRLRETYTSTEYGLSHSFGFDLGEGYDTSFFAGPNAEPGLATAQRVCGALTHFFLRIKDSPTLIVDVTYPAASPSGWPFYFRPDQSEIRVLQGYNWDLYDADGNIAMLPDEYAVVEPVAVRDTYGVNTEVVAPSRILIVDGQIRLSWSQSPVSAYALFANVSINIPGMMQTWPSLSHVDVNLPPNAIPGSPLFDGMDDRIFGEGWSIFAAYDSHLNRLDINDLYLVGGADLSPVYLRANRYITVCSVWLSYTPPPPPPFDEDSTYILVNEETGAVEYYEVGPGLVFAQVGYSLMDAGSMILCLELTDDFGQFWLSASGRASTTDTVLRDNNKQYLRGEAGAITDDPDVIALYDQAPSLAYIDVLGNIFAGLTLLMTHPFAPGDYAFKNERYPGSGYDLSLYTVATGSVRSAWSVLVEKVSLSPAEITAYFTSRGAAITEETYMRTGAVVNLYYADGSRIPYDSSKTYSVVDARYNDGTSLSAAAISAMSISGDASGLQMTYSGGSRISALVIDFTAL